MSLHRYRCSVCCGPGGLEQLEQWLAHTAIWARDFLVVNVDAIQANVALGFITGHCAVWLNPMLVWNHFPELSERDQRRTACTWTWSESRTKFENKGYLLKPTECLSSVRLPYLRTNLIATLANLNMKNFPHFRFRFRRGPKADGSVEQGRGQCTGQVAVCCLIWVTRSRAISRCRPRWSTPPLTSTFSTAWRQVSLSKRTRRLDCRHAFISRGDQLRRRKRVAPTCQRWWPVSGSDRKQQWSTCTRKSTLEVLMAYAPRNFRPFSAAEVELAKRPGPRAVSFVDDGPGSPGRSAPVAVDVVIDAQHCRCIFTSDLWKWLIIEGWHWQGDVPSRWQWHWQASLRAAIDLVLSRRSTVSSRQAPALATDQSRGSERWYRCQNWSRRSLDCCSKSLLLDSERVPVTSPGRRWHGKAVHDLEGRS